MGDRLRVAVIGGGLGGLAAGLALLRNGLDVTVYEQAEALGEIGAGVTVYPNSLRLLERAGLGPALAAVGATLGEGSEYYRMDGSLVGSIVTRDSSGWNGFYGMHRADLLNALAGAIPSEVVRTGHRFLSCEQDEHGARIVFANGEVATADVVVGADGIHSALREFVTESSPPVYSGSRAYRGLVSRDDVPDWRPNAHQVWMGDGKHFMVYPVRRGELLNYVAFVPTEVSTIESWSAVGNRDELVQSFSGGDPRVTNLLGKVQNCYWWGLYDRAPLKTWTNGRLILVGDAAHAMLPHLGQGANQGIEDGFALAAFLKGSRPENAPALLESFTAFRRARTDLIQAEARRNGLRFDSKYKSLDERDQEIRKTAEFRRWAYDYDVEQAANDAKAQLAGAAV